jgi:hypothetical protein
MSQFIKSSLLATAAVLSMAASGAHAESFNFYQSKTLSNLVDTNSSVINVTSGNIGLALSAVSSSSSAKVTRRWDGVGVNSGLGDPGDLNSSLLGSNTLLLTFNQLVSLNSLGFSSWDNGIFGIGADKVSITTGGKTYNLSSNDGKSPITTFSLASLGLQGQSFLITAQGATSSFRLANVNATLAVPEAGTSAMLGLGLAGIALVARRRKSRKA